MPEPTHEPTTQDKQRHNKYARMIKGVQVDFYDVARAFGVTDPAIAHALKKLLRYGCGEKPLYKDVNEAIFSLERWKEAMKDENAERQSLGYPPQQEPDPTIPAPPRTFEQLRGKL